MERRASVGRSARLIRRVRGNATLSSNDLSSFKPISTVRSVYSFRLQ